MALTDDQITAQNFKEFYSQIRPYLNGNSPVCVNQFNKSDLYSTDEKMIGCWIDGKPLYQKAYKLDNLSNGDVQFDSNVDGIDIVVDFKVLPFSDQYNMVQTVGENSYWPSVAYYHKDTKKIHISVNSSYYSSNSYVIVIFQYTKINDTQISITDVNDYSTDEHIVGHWIDGKPLYQKTYIVTNATSNKIIEDYSQKQMIDYSGIYLHTDGNRLHFPYYHGSTTMQMNQNANSGNLVIHCSDISGGTVYATARYTKTTD